MPRGLLFDTLIQYTEEIAAVRATIRRVLALGAENENESGGSSRKMRDTDLQQLREYLSQLTEERAILERGVQPVCITPGW